MGTSSDKESLRLLKIPTALSLNTIGQTEGDFHYVLIAEAPSQQWNTQIYSGYVLIAKPRVSMWNTTQYILPGPVLFHIPPRYSRAEKGRHSLRQ